MTCSVDKCDIAIYCRELCRKHYARWYRNGSPTGGVVRYSSPDASFLAKLAPVGDCVEWVAGKNGNGYGRFWVSGEMVYAHRYAWEKERGTIPPGFVVDHICHNPACVKLDHLRLATIQQNSQNRRGANPSSRTKARGVKRARSKWQARVTKDGVSHHLGTYESVAEASSAADTARQKLFGEYAGKA